MAKQPRWRYIGDVYRAWGFPPEAIRFYHDALKVYPATHKKAEEAAVLNYLGLSFFLMGDKKKCVSYLDQALAAYHATKTARERRLLSPTSALPTDFFSTTPTSRSITFRRRSQN